MLQPYPVYASSISRLIKPRALALKLKELHDIHGIMAFKVKVGRRMGRDEDEWPGRTSEVIRECKSALGGSVKLAVDANGAYDSLKVALKEGDELHKQDVWFLEEPFPWFQYDKYIEFAPEICIAGGEQEFRLDVWERSIPQNPFQVSPS